MACQKRACGVDTSVSTISDLTKDCVGGYRNIEKELVRCSILGQKEWSKAVRCRVVEPKVGHTSVISRQIYNEEINAKSFGIKMLFLGLALICLNPEIVNLETFNSLDSR